MIKTMVPFGITSHQARDITEDLEVDTLCEGFSPELGCEA